MDHKKIFEDWWETLKLFPNDDTSEKYDIIKQIAYQAFLHGIMIECDITIKQLQGGPP